MTLQLPIFLFFFPGLDSIGEFICEADFLVEICLDKLESFPAGLGKYAVELCDRRVCAQSLEHLPISDCSHINHRGEYLPIYCEDGYNYRNGVVLDTAELLHCLLPEGRPRLFWMIYDSKVFFLNLEADKIALVLQVRYAMPVEIEHTVQ